MLRRIKMITGTFLRSRPMSTSHVSYQNDPVARDEPPGGNILVEKDTNITLIGINREEKRNSIDSATAAELSRTLEQFENDDSSPVAVLYGIGGSFSAGYDVQELEQETERGQLDFLMNAEGAVVRTCETCGNIFLRRFHHFKGPTRRHLRKPIICGINGFCVANGVELALLCDLRVMEESAILGFFNRRLGVPISDGGTARLAAMIGYSRALDLIVSGRRVTGPEALQMGLINRLVATGTSLGQAVNLAFCIAKFPMASLRHDRSSLYANVYDKSNFVASTQNEIMYTSQDVISEMNEGLLRFRQSEKKGAKTNSWNIKSKSIPDWEQEEIDIEEQYANLKNRHKAKANV